MQVHNRIQAVWSHNGDLAGVAIPDTDLSLGLTAAALHSSHKDHVSIIRSLSLGSAYEKTRNYLCLVQLLSCTRFQDLYALEKIFHYQISHYRWTCHQCHCGALTMNQEIIIRREKPLYSSAQSTEFFCSLWNFVCQEVKDTQPKGWPSAIM